MLVTPKIAKLRAQLYAAIRQQLRSCGEIVVRREIEIVGHREFDAAARRVTASRKEKSGLALGADRKGNYRRIENRNALEVEPHVASDAAVFDGVEVDAPRVQHPVVIADRAGGECNVLQLRARVLGDVNTVGDTPRRARRQLECGLAKGCALDGIEVAGDSMHMNRAVPVVDFTVHGEVTARLVILDVLGAHFPAGLAQDHAALERCVSRARDFGDVAFDDDLFVVGRLEVGGRLRRICA